MSEQDSVRRNAAPSSCALFAVYAMRLGPLKDAA
jgi:hypothetical protein